MVPANPGTKVPQRQRGNQTQSAGGIARQGVEIFLLAVGMESGVK